MHDRRPKQPEKRDGKQKRVFFLSVRTVNKVLENEMRTVEEEIESRMGSYMEDGDTSDKKTQDVRKLIEDLRVEYKRLTSTMKTDNFFIRSAQKLPLPRFLAAIHDRNLVLENMATLKSSVKKSTDQRKGYLEVTNYAFCKEEPCFSAKGTASTSDDSWRVEFTLLATADSKKTWEDILEYSEEDFESWWLEKRQVKSQGSKAWLDLKALCKCIVFILDDVSSEYLADFPSLGRLSSIAKMAQLIVVQLVRLHWKYPQQDYGISLAFGYTTPVIFVLWRTTDRAMRCCKHSMGIQALASDVLSIAVEELGKLMSEINELVLDFGALLLAQPYLANSKDIPPGYVPKPKVLHLFNFDQGDFSEKAAAFVLESKLMECRADFIKACTGIQNIESSKAVEIIESNVNLNSDLRFDSKELEHDGLHKIDVDPEPSKILGCGAYSVVRCHKRSDSSEVYALKCYKSKALQTCNLIKHESSIWIKLKHKHILPLLGYATLRDDPYPSLVTQVCLDGSLERFLKEYPSESEKKRLSYLQDIICGLQYLHSNDIAHGDLRAANVLVQRSPNCKETYAVLCDFGASNVVREVKGGHIYAPTSSQRTRDNWLAPEMLFSNESIISRVSKEADMYAFGCIILEVMFGKRPYASYPPESVRAAKQQGCPPATKAEMNDRYWLIANECWLYEWKERATSSWVLSKIGNLLNHSEL